MKTKIISFFLSLLFLSTAMGQQLAPLAEQTSIPRIVDAFLKRGNKVLEQDARFAGELVWFDAVVRQKWGQWEDSYKKIYNECVERNYFASRNAWIQLDHYFGSEAHWTNPKAGGLDDLMAMPFWPTGDLEAEANGPQLLQRQGRMAIAVLNCFRQIPREKIDKLSASERRVLNMVLHYAVNTISDDKCFADKQSRLVTLVDFIGAVSESNTELTDSRLGALKQVSILWKAEPKLFANYALSQFKYRFHELGQLSKVDQQASAKVSRLGSRVEQLIKPRLSDFSEADNWRIVADYAQIGWGYHSSYQFKNWDRAASNILVSLDTLERTERLSPAAATNLKAILQELLSH